MTYYLVVTRPFLNFTRGDIITDSVRIAEIMSSEYRKFIVKAAPPNAAKG